MALTPAQLAELQRMKNSLKPGNDEFNRRMKAITNLEQTVGPVQLPTDKKAKGGSVEPKKTVKAYKLFRVNPKQPGKLFPLFVNANDPVEMDAWQDAQIGEMAGDKVKSKIGPLAFRPGWHAGDVPVATHIGEKSDPSLTAPDVRPANHVWAEVEMPNDVDWQSVANERGTNAQGRIVPVKAHITDQIPKGGHYRYKTNSNMTGNWLIGGSMKVNRVLSDKEVKAINKAAGVADLPRAQPFNPKKFGFSKGGSASMLVLPDYIKNEEIANYRDPESTKIHDWNWRKLKEVLTDVPLTEVPDYVQKGYGEFMNEQRAKAKAGKLSPRDLLKAFTITQSSIGRGGLSHASATKTGMKLPNTGGEVRPEGAFAEWLGSPMGQKYLNAAEQGSIDHTALGDIQQKFAPFGKQNQLIDQMAYAVNTVPSMAQGMNQAVMGDKEGYRDWAEKLKGIAGAKSGFIGSMLGRGDLPTLDARQLNLHTLPANVGVGSIMSRGKGTGAREAVDRLSARQQAMNLRLDPSMASHYQHLAHHAVWDAMGKNKTTHDDLVKAMRGYADGGTTRKGGNPTVDEMRRAIAKASGSNPPMAEKNLTTMQDFYTSLGDSVRARAMEAQKQMDSWDYKYEPGQHVFTDSSAKRNLPPYKILNRTRYGNDIVREDQNDFTSKKVIDPKTGKAKRTPFVPGYKVRMEHSPDNWSEFVIPESAIKGHVDMAKGGVVHLAVGGQGPKNWIKGGVEQVTNPLKQEVLNEEGLRNLEARTGADNTNAYKAGKVNDYAVNQWIDRNLTNYIKKQMATHDDPIRKLAEQGIVHMPPEQMGYGSTQAEGVRKVHGAPRLGQSPEAQAWEDATDVAMHPMPIKDLHRDYREPWMVDADPQTKIFTNTDNMHAHYLGFDHLVDIIKQDLNEGRIRPEQLSKVSIEHAVRRAHEYDQERKKAMGETALKATEGMPVHKEYPEGYKWIELALNPKLPEGHRMTPAGTYVDPEGNESIYHPNYAKLDDALKYEGDTMGHCVGGYTPDVVSGKSRIFSLRDAKNEPHVTVEVKPKNVDKDYIAKHGEPAPSINQIKGKGNTKPKKDYIPFVQDFVKSGNWSDVGDIKNADMIKQKGQYLTHAEHDDWLADQLKPDAKAQGGTVHIAKGDDMDTMKLEMMRRHMATGGRPSTKGYVTHEPKNPHPEVGKRFKATPQGNLAPMQAFDLMKHEGKGSIVPIPYDATTRDNLVTEVSGNQLINPLLTEAGFDYSLDKSNMAQDIGGASNSAIARRVQDRVNQAHKEHDGDVFLAPNIMGEDAENFSHHPAHIVLDLMAQRQLNPNTLQALSDDLRGQVELKRNAKTGAVTKIYPYTKFVGYHHPKLMEQVIKGGRGLETTAGNLRKKMMERLSLVNMQKLLDYNMGDLKAAILDPDLATDPKAYMGRTMVKAQPGAALRPSKHTSYDTDYTGTNVGGLGGNRPLEIMMPDVYESINTELNARPAKVTKTPAQMRTQVVGALEKRKENFAQPINARVINNAGLYAEGLRQGEFDPKNVDSVLAYFKRKGGYADGGTVDIKKVGVEEAPDMDVKAYFPPYPARSGQLPVGGIEQAPQQPPQQQQPQQPPQGVPPQGMPPQGAPAQQSPSNILQMTRQGQAMNAMTPTQPPQPPQMARGGSTRRVAYNSDPDAMMLELMQAKRYFNRK